MRMILALSLFLAFPYVFAQTNHQRLQEIKNLQRISFGSCNNEEDVQELWTDLIKQKPDLWIWGGDNIYADWKGSEAIREAYEKQNKIPEYVAFKKQTPIIGTWDDHDYAYDNATGYYQFKKESQEYLLDFLEVPQDSPRRDQEGIYTSHTFGEGEKKIKIIILDNRYFKMLEPDYPLLGKTQWDWLEGELTNSDAALHFIVAGLSVLSPLIPYTEEWAHTGELNRMLTLLDKTKPRGVVFLTGDKHFSAIFSRHGHLEFMSSGMTHLAPRRTWWYLGRRYQRTFFGISYGQIDIEWESSIPVISLSMRNRWSEDIHLTKFRWNETRWSEL